MTTNVMTPLSSSTMEDKNIKYHLVEAEEIEPTSTQAKKNPRMKKGKVQWSQFPLIDANATNSSSRGTYNNTASNNNQQRNHQNNGMRKNNTNQDGKSNNHYHNSNNSNNQTSTSSTIPVAQHNTNNYHGGKKHHHHHQNQNNNNNNNDGQPQNSNNTQNYHNKKNYHRNKGGRGKWKDRSNNGKRYGHDGHQHHQQQQQTGGYYQGVFVPQMDPKITAEYAKQQVEYYFTPENLVRDTFLRQQMDVDGYVPVAFIASFQSVYAIHQGYASLLESLKHSEVVEMDIPNEKIRTRFSWRQWLWPNPNGGYGLPKYIKMSGNSTTNNSIKHSSASSSSSSSTSSSSTASAKVVEPSPEDDVEHNPESSEANPEKSL